MQKARRPIIEPTIIYVNIDNILFSLNLARYPLHLPVGWEWVKSDIPHSKLDVLLNFPTGVRPT